MKNKDMIINFYKPKAMTSRDVVNRLVKILNTKKIGHTGTLDPLASGVLVICVNKATKLVELLSEDTKEYIATMKLGVLTDTLDITGNILKQEVPKSYSINQITDVLNSFLGKSMQQVPKYSAVKIRGKKLYEYARENIQIDLPIRQIQVFSIEFISYINDEISFKVEVSKGTYIRSLIQDIALKLKTIATMSDLIRSRVGEYKLENSCNFDDIINNNYHFISLKQALSVYQSISLTDQEYFKIKNAQIIKNIYNEDMVVFLYQGEVVALYKSEDKYLKPFKMFIS